jgi:hypothetical protein
MSQRRNRIFHSIIQRAGRIGEGDAYNEAVADVQSAIQLHIAYERD